MTSSSTQPTGQHSYQAACIAAKLRKDNKEWDKMTLPERYRALLAEQLEGVAADWQSFEVAEEAIFNAELGVGYLSDSLTVTPSDKATATGVAASIAAHVMATMLIERFRMECKHWSDFAKNGGYDFLTPEQQRLADLYDNSHYWAHSLYMVGWYCFAAPGALMAPQFYQRLLKDAGALIEWATETFPLTVRRAAHKENWNSLVGDPSEKWAQQAARCGVTVLGFAAGAVVVGVTAGPIGVAVKSIAFLNKFSMLLSSAGMGSTVPGVAAGGIEVGSVMQRTTKQGFRLKNKLWDTRVPIAAISSDKAKQEQLCAQLSLVCTGVSWLDRIRISVASGDTNKIARGYQKWTNDQFNAAFPEGSEARHQAAQHPGYFTDGRDHYVMFRKSRTYKGTASVAGMAGGALLGFALLGPPGAIIGAGLGYVVGNFVGAKLSFFKKENKDAKDQIIQPVTLNEVLYEEQEEIKHELRKHTIIGGFLRYYFANPFYNTLRQRKEGEPPLGLGDYAKSTLAAIGLGIAKLATDIVKFPVKYVFFTVPRNVMRAGSLIRSFGQQTGRGIQSDWTSKHKGRAIAKAVFAMLAAPFIAVASTLSILDPRSQMEAYKEKETLMQRKAAIKGELASLAQAYTNFNEQQQSHQAPVKKRDDIEREYAARYRMLLAQQPERDVTARFAKRHEHTYQFSIRSSNRSSKFDTPPDENQLVLSKLSDEKLKLSALNKDGKLEEYTFNSTEDLEQELQKKLNSKSPLLSEADKKIFFDLMTRHSKTTVYLPRSNVAVRAAARVAGAYTQFFKTPEQHKQKEQQRKTEKVKKLPKSVSQNKPRGSA